MKLPNEVSESVKKLNPSLFNPLAPAQSPKLQSDQGPSLVKSVERTEGRKGGSRSGVRNRKRIPILAVTLVAVTRRQLDSDNLAIGAKWIRDAISKQFGIDDNDRLVRWHYGWIQAAMEEGVIVRIETMVQRRFGARPCNVEAEQQPPTPKQP